LGAGIEAHITVDCAHQTLSLAVTFSADGHIGGLRLLPPDPLPS
jgi:hypothetical protein